MAARGIAPLVLTKLASGALTNPLGSILKIVPAWNIPPNLVVPYKEPLVAWTSPFGLRPSAPPVKDFKVANLVPATETGMTVNRASALVAEPRELVTFSE